MQPAFALLNPPRIALPQSLSVNLQILLRWIHFLAAITWIGLLYFFNLVSPPFLKAIDASTRSRVVPALMPRALWWFRWSAVVTVLAGIWYWMTIVGADARNGRASGGVAVMTFFIIWTAVFIAEMAMLMGPVEALRKGAVFGVIVGIVVIVASYLYLALNSHGWESNRLLAIGIGGGIGWVLLLNVWGVIWRGQKRIIRWTRESAAQGTPMPPEAAKLARVGYLASRAGFALSFPLLFFMGAASHYPMFGP